MKLFKKNREYALVAYDNRIIRKKYFDDSIIILQSILFIHLPNIQNHSKLSAD